MAAKLRGPARRVMLWVTSRIPADDPRTLSLVARAWAGQESSGRITDLRLAHLNRLTQRPLRQKNYERLLYLAARYEALGKNWPIAAGDLIARQMVSDAGRRRIRDASAKALEMEPSSAFLVYLNAVTTAKCGDPVAASRMVSDRFKLVLAELASSPHRSKAIRRRFKSLRDTWRMVDLIAREETSWLDEEGGSTYAALADEVSTLSGTAGTEEGALTFKEPLLQARDEEGYLRFCVTEFDEARTLDDRLRAIKDMLRHAVRRQITYHRAYQLARESYGRLLADVSDAAAQDERGFRDEATARRAVQTLTLAIEVCRKLGNSADEARFKEALLRFSRWPVFASTRWVILDAVASDGVDSWVAQSRSLRAQIKTLPEREGDLKAFFRWAVSTRSFGDAQKIFVKLPPALKYSQASLYYVNILQRQGQFIEAMRLLKRVHAYMMAKPARLNPISHWGLVRRHGEISFLRKTAKYYSRERQPRKPVGVILIGPRNIDQLRKYPLVVLMSLKKMGWAVVPLVEGLLPREPTGKASIDILNGCIPLDNGVATHEESQFPQIDDIGIDTTRGLFEFDGIDLSHPLLEDARISRRAFNVDLTCPVLSNYLSSLCQWTVRYARALEYARQSLAGQGLRCGLMSLFNSRLPDAMFRMYCDDRGDPDNFFCLHTANGYENYFKNFSTNISTRCVIRNVTKYSHVRASSMPIPELFERYYENHKGDLANVLARVEDVASIRRTTAGVSVQDPAAVECEARIMKWRENGGKVVCLMGRVVCDSAVPFDGGPAHKDLSDWLNHSIEAVCGSNTLLLIKPHPHELNEQIGTYLNEYFSDLLKVEIPENVIMLGHKWFDIQSLKRFVDLGVVYNSTAAIELALQEIPAVLCGHFGPIDYPVGHLVPKSRRQYENMLRFKSRAKPAPDMRARAAMWLQYMSLSGFIQDYRYHSRPTTNKVVYPPYWVDDDMKTFFAQGDVHVSILAKRAIGALAEPHV